jgi:hypothetical protein
VICRSRTFITGHWVGVHGDSVRGPLFSDNGSSSSGTFRSVICWPSERMAHSLLLLAGHMLEASSGGSS